MQIINERIGAAPNRYKSYDSADFVILGHQSNIPGLNFHRIPMTTEVLGNLTGKVCLRQHARVGVLPAFTLDSCNEWKIGGLGVSYVNFSLLNTLQGHDRNVIKLVFIEDMIVDADFYTPD